MSERRRRAELVEVGLTGEQQAPIGDVSQPACHVGAQIVELVGGRSDRAEHQHEREDEKERGEETPGSAGVERTQGDGPAAPEFRDEQRGDQVARQHEERVDAEEPTGCPRLVAVIGEHSEHGEGADPVEGRLVGEATAGGRGAAGALRPGHRRERRWRGGFDRGACLGRLNHGERCYGARRVAVPTGWARTTRMGGVHAAAVRFDLHIPLSRSLKEKRAAVRPIVDSVRHRFPVSAAEVGHLDRRQRAAIGVAVVSGSSTRTDEILAAVERFVAAAPDVELIDVSRAWLELDEAGAR